MPKSTPSTGVTGPAKQPATSAQPRSGSATITEPPRILVADSDPLTRKLVRSLENEGYQVVVVSDGRQAHRLIKSNADFNTAVFNIPLPGSADVEIVRYLKADVRLRLLPVVVITDCWDADFLRDSFAAGAVAFLWKPFTSHQLLQAVRIALSSKPSKNLRG